MEYPMRINKYLALRKYATRRGADVLIKAGKVTINGRVAVLGDKVQESDSVKVDEGAVAAAHQNYVYYAYNKPLGVVTHSPQKGEVDIAGSIKLPGVFPVGRLDKDSHGLIILTNDGRVTERLLSPLSEHEKEYAVKVDKPLKQSALTRLSKGVKIEGYITKPAVAEESGLYSLQLTITEGKRHQIRRMLTALGYQVQDLKRVRVMSVKLGDLKPGGLRKLQGKELRDFLRELDL
jgi:23S rRNA pseudouridine2604 synthase